MEWQKIMPLHQRVVVRMAAPTKITYLHPRKIPYQPTVRPKCNKTYMSSHEYLWLLCDTFVDCGTYYDIKTLSQKPKTVVKCFWYHTKNINFGQMEQKNIILQAH